MEQCTVYPGTRRVALKVLAATTLAPLSACSLFLRPKDLQPVCPNAPAVSDLGGPLTIDAHCHVFNGTDLQVQEFLSRVAVKQGGVFGFAARAIGELLENLAWEYAPSGEEELAALEKVITAAAAALQISFIENNACHSCMDPLGSSSLCDLGLAASEPKFRICKFYEAIPLCFVITATIHCNSGAGRDPAAA